ncbi:MAG: hypothetical protein JWO05_3223 [Gemmatimonadetes bacterium]|nr:hypothetical protein [Gemmatimonadota bacterium]
MSSRSPVTRALALLVTAAPLAIAARTLRAQDARCSPVPPAVAAGITAGWSALRSAALDSAQAAFSRATLRCPGLVDPVTGLGYVALRTDHVARAESLFVRAIAMQADAYDALMGIGRIEARTGRIRQARQHFERALAAVPRSREAIDAIAQLPDVVDSTMLAPYVRPLVLSLPARTGKRIIEVAQPGGGFAPAWLKMINLGAALPGKHPSEFPANDSTYERWIAMSAGMGANAIRVYTIHPPHFYAALRNWNLAHPAQPMWLVHGIWTEPPEGELEERYDDPAFVEQFQSEMRRIADLLHGRAAIEPRPGHAHGLYTADVSPWTIAYITGREWEPYSVEGFASSNPHRPVRAGKWVTATPDAGPLEAWMAEQCDYLADYEMSRWNTQRPMAYTNWPTLDPLHHSTESTLAQEDSIRGLRGEDVEEKPREYDNDAIGLDAMHMRATPQYRAGVFASYHAYPYYPDFLGYDPGYLKARSPEGPSNYFGYLRELVEHHGDMPVVISEYGVPSSRGNAHFQPQGWNHGGHDEQEQASIDARLTRDIYAAGAAGAGLFAMIDEWFKKNWIVIDFEKPLERNRLWLNTLDAEQNYGVIAMRAGVKDSAIRIDGQGADWKGRERFMTGRAPAASAARDPRHVKQFGVSWDEAFVYLRLDVDTLDFARAAYSIGIDTRDTAGGNMRMPFTGTRSPVGLEFVVELTGRDSSRLVVNPSYALYSLRPIRSSNPPAFQSLWNRPFISRRVDDGIYSRIVVEPNRRRFGRDGTVFQSRLQERGLLRFSTQDSSSLSDWYADPATGIIEVRLPWGLINVLDPSSRSVLQGLDGRDPNIAKTPGFRFVVESYDPRNPAGGAERIPAQPNGAFALPPLWSWPEWEVPRWYPEVKPVYDAMRRTFDALPQPKSRP